MFFNNKYSVVNTNNLAKRAMDIKNASKTSGTANNTTSGKSAYGPSLPVQGPMPKPASTPVLDQGAALDELRKNVLAGNVPNSGSGIVPTTQQRAKDFAGSAITSNNRTVDVEKASPSNVTYAEKESEPAEVDTREKDGGKAEEKDESKLAYAEEAEAPTLSDYGIGFENTGFSYDDFQVSEAYTQAMNYTNSLLAQLGSGRTSYTDRIEGLMKEYQNRDKFSYDMNSDALFQQMLASSMNSGKMAMEDTIGQAAALTGGYGNTYGTAAGNMAYNQYISEAYGNLPEYYNLALDAYNMEGDKMLSELAMLQDADNAEYNRLLNSYKANLDNANAMYDREYTEYLNDRNAAEKDYWNTLDFNYGAYKDQVDQANKDREFEFKSDWADKEWEYTTAKDAIGLLGGAGGSGYESLSNSEIGAINEIYSSKGGGEKGADAVEAYLAALGKNVDMDVVASVLDTSYDPLTPYYELIDAMDMSEEQKIALKTKMQSK